MFGSRARAYIRIPPTMAVCVRCTTQPNHRSDFEKGTGVMPNRDHPKFECTRLIPSSDTTIVAVVSMSHTLFWGNACSSGNKSLWNSFKGPGGEVNILDALRPTNDYKCLALDNFPPHNKSSSTPMALTSASIKRIWISIPYPLGEIERRERKAKRAYLMHETANKTPTMSHKTGKQFSHSQVFLPDWCVSERFYFRKNARQHISMMNSKFSEIAASQFFCAGKKVSTAQFVEQKMYPQWNSWVSPRVRGNFSWISSLAVESGFCAKIESMFQSVIEWLKYLNIIHRTIDF